MDPGHIDLNVPVVNLSKLEVSIKKATEKVEIVDPDHSLTVYDLLFQDILVKEDASEKSSEEEAQLDDEVFA